MPLEQIKKPDYVYVASSWSNWKQDIVVQCLQGLSINCYDFKKDGFSWKEVMPSYDGGVVGVGEYLDALEHPRSNQGFKRDYDAMMKADAFILVLPCGRSAHLELGWAVGMGIPTAILLDGDYDEDNWGKVTPDLMYKMVDLIAPDIHCLLSWFKG